MHATVDREPVRNEIPTELLNLLSALSEAQAEDEAADEAVREANARSEAAGFMIDAARRALAQFLWDEPRTRMTDKELDFNSRVVVAGGKAFFATRDGIPTGQGPALRVLDLAVFAPQPAPVPAESPGPSPHPDPAGPVVLPELAGLVAAHAEALARAREAAALEERPANDPRAAKLAEERSNRLYQAVYAVEGRLAILAAARGLVPAHDSEYLALVAGRSVVLIERETGELLATVVPVVGVAGEGGRA